MIYEQFIVSIVELIMLSWQQISSYNFHNMRVTWLFYQFFKLQVHILHGLSPGQASTAFHKVQHLLHIVACWLVVFNRQVAKRLQYFVQHDTTFLQKYLEKSRFIISAAILSSSSDSSFSGMVNLPFFFGSSPVNSSPPSRDYTSTSDSSSESILKDCKTSKTVQIKNIEKAQPKVKIATTQLTKFAKKFP